jgi:hypothetical protein
MRDGDDADGDGNRDECVLDPDASPLQVGRVPLRVPPCDEAGGPSPNPCLRLVDQVAEVTRFELTDRGCVVADDQELERRTDIEAIEVRNPALTMHIIDTATRGDEACNGDRAGALLSGGKAPAFSAVYPGFEIDVPIVGGFSPMQVLFGGGAFVPTMPIRISPAPDGRLWVLDQGDAAGGTNGRLFTLDPSDAIDLFGTVLIQ